MMHMPLNWGAMQLSRLGALTRMRSIAMTCITYRRHLTGAVAVAALMVNAPAATAQPTDVQLRTGIDDAIRALDKSPRLKELSPHRRSGSWNSLIANTIFVMSHEMGHGPINEMNMPVFGREEDAADSFAALPR
jgi:hypothetical protein